MAIWIETEEGCVLLNADQVQTFFVCPKPVPANEGADFSVVASGEGFELTLLRGLTAPQALQAVKHLATWLPAQTGRTIRMSELGKGLRRAALTLVGEDGDHD